MAHGPMPQRWRVASSSSIWCLRNSARQISYDATASVTAWGNMPLHYNLTSPTAGQDRIGHDDAEWPIANPDLHHGLGRDAYLSRQREKLEVHCCIITCFSDSTHPRLHTLRGCQLIAVAAPRQWLVKSQASSPTAAGSSQPTHGETSTPWDGAERQMRCRGAIMSSQFVRNHHSPPTHSRLLIDSLHPSQKSRYDQLHYLPLTPPPPSLPHGESLEWDRGIVDVMRKTCLAAVLHPIASHFMPCKEARLACAGCCWPSWNVVHSDTQLNPTMLFFVSEPVGSPSW